MWGQGKFPHSLPVTPEKPGSAASRCCVSCALHSTDGRQGDGYLLTFPWSVSFSKALKLPEVYIYLGMLLLSLKKMKYRCIYLQRLGTVYVPEASSVEGNVWGLSRG